MSKNVTLLDGAEVVEPALEFVSYIGGCCGSDPEYIKEIAKLLK